MKAILITLLAILFMVEGLLLEIPSLDDTALVKQTIKQVPLFLVTTLKTVVKKATRLGSVIAHPYKAIILLASGLNPNEEFLHYIQVYSSIRTKKYFLLI